MSKRDRKEKSRVDDWHLWSEVTKSVSPIRNAIEPKPGRRPVTALSSTALPPQTFSKAPPIARPLAKMAPIDHTRLFQGKPSKNSINLAPPETKIIEPRIKRRLMRGQLPIDGTIDLHGMRQVEAHAALRRFIASRYRRGDRTILVITGKGLKNVGYGEIEQRGVLRAMLPAWLSDKDVAPMVAGWEASAQSHGGEGAYYVRLKRLRR